jgi:hypothetical protein
MCGSPSVPPVTKPPQREDPKVAESAAKEQARLKARKGRQSTILTSGTGVTEDVNSKKKKLLGQ